MQFETYTFQNVYVIATYRCNWRCEFCLFKYNKEDEATTAEIIHRLEYAINDSQQKVYIKITGGEPFLKLDLLKNIFALAEKYSDKIYKIGIGTNGSIPLPYYFSDITTRTHIFISRHELDNGASIPKLPIPTDLGRYVDNPLIDFRLNCNLIKGQIDNIDKIKEHIENWVARGITHFCFRELNRVNVDTNLIYPEQIYEYIKYYKKHYVPLTRIRKVLSNEKGFRYSRNTGNFYDDNHWYWYTYGAKKISVKFRTIDEVKLIEFNVHVKPNDVDEYVVHPDGTLTGCWDKELKVITEGGVSQCQVGHTS